MIRLVLFDIDGTLIRTGGAGVEAFRRAAATEFGRAEAIDGMRFAGRTDPSLVREFFGRAGIAPSPSHFTRFFDAYVFWLDHLLPRHSGDPCAGVAQWLEDLERLPTAPLVGLLTGNIRLGAEIKLRHYGLWGRFVTGAFGDDHEDRNRLAAIAQARGAALLERPLSGEEMLVVGDTPHDVACGRAVGARVLAVATGGASAQDLEACRPDWLVADLSRLRAAEVCG